MSSRVRSLVLIAPILATSTLGLPAACFALDCAGTGGPAATLLVPYFEVDLDQPGGRTTLFSVANAGEADTVARVVLWSNLGIPTLAFDVLARADGVVSVNLRDVFSGELPVTGAEPWDKPESCDGPLALPDLSGPALADLRARHAGLPSSDGLCFGAPVGEGLVTGYVTVDVMSGCLPDGRVPGDGKPYFAGEGGLAGEDNVLWGDVFLIDAAGNRAEGLRAVPVPAEPYPVLDGKWTFYSGVVDGGVDRRRRLPDVHRIRFLVGPDTQTDLILWSGRGGFNHFPQPPHEGQCTFITHTGYFLRGWNEGGGEPFDSDLGTPLLSWRVSVGSHEVPAPIPFGTLELETYGLCHNCSNPYGGPLQAWAGALTGAEGRFAVGLEAVGLGPCY